jgi:hypothetical protein
MTNRHLTTRPLSVPADIQGGDAVAVETPSRRNDALSVRTYRQYGESKRQLVDFEGLAPMPVS